MEKCVFFLSEEKSSLNHVVALIGSLTSLQSALGNVQKEHNSCQLLLRVLFVLYSFAGKVMAKNTPLILAALRAINARQKVRERGEEVEGVGVRLQLARKCRTTLQPQLLWNPEPEMASDGQPR